MRRDKVMQKILKFYGTLEKTISKRIFWTYSTLAFHSQSPFVPEAISLGGFLSPFLDGGRERGQIFSSTLRLSSYKPCTDPGDLETTAPTLGNLKSPLTWVQNIQVPLPVIYLNILSQIFFPDYNFWGSQGHKEKLCADYLLW